MEPDKLTIEQYGEKKIVAIDSQVLNNLESCYHKWYLYNIKNWRPKGRKVALDKGTLLHEIFRAYYQALINGKDWNSAVKEAMEHGHQYIVKLKCPLEDIEEVFKTCNEYFSFYGGDKWIPLAVEETFSYVMYQDDDLVILYEGIVDLRVRTDVDENAPVDHKSTSRNDAIHSLNNQFIGYCRAHQAPRMYINRVGFQKTLPKEERFVRHTKSYDKQMQEEWAEEVIHTVKMGLLHHDIGIYPRNFTSCDTKYGPCMFSKVCQQVKAAQEWELKTTFDVDEEGWDALKRDEK